MIKISVKYIQSVILFLILFSNSFCYAQSLSKEDSLLSVLKTAKEDTNKVNTLNLLSEYAGWRIDNYDTAFFYAQNALQLAEKSKYKYGVAVSKYNFGKIYYWKNNYPEALKNLFIALEIFKVLNNKIKMASTYNSIGLVYANQSNYTEALKYHFSSLKIVEEIGDKRGIGVCYSGIANVYAYQDNYTEALKYYFKKLKIDEELGDKKSIANSYNNIGCIYLNQGNYLKAISYLTISIEKYEEIKYKFGIAYAYFNLGLIYKNQNNYTNALNNYFESIKIKEEIGDKYGAVSTYNAIGEIYIKQNKALPAKLWLQKGMILAKQIGFNDGIRESYGFQSKADSIAGNYKGAYENYKQYIIYRDSLYNEENTKKLVQTQMQYDFDKKEAATKAEQDKKDAIATSELKRKDLQRNASVAGLLLMLLLAGVFFTQRNRINKEKNRSEQLLLNILPYEVAEELKEYGESEAKHFDEVTVLFTDFVDFTIISESLLPTELVKELHTCFKAFDDIITRHGLEKIKTIGDAYMAVCGLPVANTQHANNTVKAAQEIVQFMEKRKQENPNGFHIRVGINSGSVVAGIVGVKKFAYDIWGDTVNTASRMESNSEAGRINISGSTYELVKNDFTCEYRGKINAKGKGEVDMYFVTQ